LDWACSWTELESTVHIISHRLKQNSTFKLEDVFIRRFIMEPSMWHVRAIPWKTAYGPKVKDACVLKETAMGETK
jgi:hypothetical protein